MKELSTVLQQVVVKQFYFRNAGFFLVSFFLLFGVQQPATFLISPYFLSRVAASPFFTAAVLGVFLLYYFKCLHFFTKTIQERESEFFYISPLLPRRELQLSLARAYLLIFLPAVVYTSWLVLVGVATGSYWAFLFVCLYQMVLLLGTVYIVERKLRGYAVGQSSDLFFKLPTLPWPAFLWPLQFLMHQEPIKLFLTKVFSVSVLLGFMRLYPYPEFDLRPTQIGFLIAVTLQALLVQRIHEFLEVGLGLHRRLPYTLLRRTGQQIFLFLALLLPEMFFLFRVSGSWITLWPFTELWLFGVSFLLLLYTLFYKPRFKQDSYFKQVFFLFIGLLLALLFAPPMWLLGLSFGTIAFFLYRRWYYQYEVEQVMVES